MNWERDETAVPWREEEGVSLLVLGLSHLVSHAGSVQEGADSKTCLTSTLVESQNMTVLKCLGNRWSETTETLKCLTHRPKTYHLQIYSVWEIAEAKTLRCLTLNIHWPMLQARSNEQGTKRTHGESSQSQGRCCGNGCSECWLTVALSSHYTKTCSSRSRGPSRRSCCCCSLREQRLQDRSCGDSHKKRSCTDEHTGWGVCVTASWGREEEGGDGVGTWQRVCGQVCRQRKVSLCLSSSGRLMVYEIKIHNKRPQRELLFNQTMSNRGTFWGNTFFSSSKELGNTWMLKGLKYDLLVYSTLQHPAFSRVTDWHGE